MTESKTPLTSETVDKNSTKVITDKDMPKTKQVDPSVVKKTSPNTSSAKLSKLAILALLIAITAPAGHYYWQQLQNQQLTQTLNNKIIEENNTTLNRYNNQTKQVLASQEQRLMQQLQKVTTSINSNNINKISELNTKIQQLEQGIKERQPSDWLLHEAEYLIRISSRTLWLEHDTSAAIGLLKDADTRLVELNDPTFLPVREVIREDINSLALMPKLDTDEVILTLMAMSKQIDQLPLAVVNLGQENTRVDINLSDDISDWQTNLAKTWQRFVNDFIRVRQRTGTVEALISPTQQENLKQNLSLKIQLALWAASERKGNVYQKALVDVQQWLTEFFDMENKVNQHFANSLVSLQQKQVNYDYPNELGSLTAIRATLKNQQTKPLNKPLNPAKKMINHKEDKVQETKKEDLQNSTKENEENIPQKESVKSEGSI